MKPLRTLSVRANSDADARQVAEFWMQVDLRKLPH
jgi:hypothetical protein